VCFVRWMSPERELKTSEHCMAKYKSLENSNSVNSPCCLHTERCPKLASKYQRADCQRTKQETNWTWTSIGHTEVPSDANTTAATSQQQALSGLAGIGKTQWQIQFIARSFNITKVLHYQAILSINHLGNRNADFPLNTSMLVSKKWQVSWSSFEF